MSKFILSVLIISSFLFTLFSNAQTNTPDFQAIIKQLQGQIKLLNQQIQDLQFRLKKTEEEVEVVKAELKFTKTVQKGQSGNEVKQLQEFLKQFPDIYPEGIITGFFGSLTEQAVKRFQEKHGIESIGIVGPKTIQKLNEFSVSVIPAIPAVPAIPGVSPAIPAIPASLSLPLQPASASQPILIPAIPAIPAILTQPFSSVPATIPSSTTTSTPTSSVSITDKTPPSAPTNLTITLSSTAPSTQADLKWSASSDNVGVYDYHVYVNGIFISSTARVLCSNSSYICSSVTQLTPSTNYTLTVIAKDAAGNSSLPSNSVSVITQSENWNVCTAEDSDGGINYGVKGYVTTSDGTYYDTCLGPGDYAPGNPAPNLKEIYCDGTSSTPVRRFWAAYHYCPYGCSNGVCNTASTPAPTPTPTPTPTPNAINEIDFAVTSVISSPSSVAAGNSVTISATFYNPSSTTQSIQVTIGKGAASVNDGSQMSVTYYLSLPSGNTTQSYTFTGSYGAISSAPGSPANTYYPEASISGVGNGPIYINPYDPSTANNYLRATSAYTVTSAPTPTPTASPAPAPTGSVSFSPDSYQTSAMANILNALKSILHTLNNLLSK